MSASTPRVRPPQPPLAQSISSCLYVGVDVDEGFGALANPTRRRLLALVRDDARPVGSLADEIELSQPATSQHLAVLREAGLVTVAADGRRRLYRVDVAALAQLRTFFDEYWTSSLDRLAATSDRIAHRSAS